MQNTVQSKRPKAVNGKEYPSNAYSKTRVFCTPSQRVTLMSGGPTMHPKPLRGALCTTLLTPFAGERPAHEMTPLDTSRTTGQHARLLAYFWATPVCEQQGLNYKGPSKGGCQAQLLAAFTTGGHLQARGGTTGVTRLIRRCQVAF